MPGSGGEGRGVIDDALQVMFVVVIGVLLTVGLVRFVARIVARSVTLDDLRSALARCDEAKVRALLITCGRLLASDVQAQAEAWLMEREEKGSQRGRP